MQQPAEIACRIIFRGAKFKTGIVIAGDDLFAVLIIKDDVLGIDEIADPGKSLLIRDLAAIIYF